MAVTLAHLITEAKALAGAHPCSVLGHDWVSIGGVPCGHGCDEGWPVHECRKCGDCDYGEPCDTDCPNLPEEAA